MSKVARRHSDRAAKIAAIVLWFCIAKAADLDPAAVAYQLPAQVKWVESQNGSAQAVIAGQPTKPGLYAMLYKWHPHHMSHPHFHPNDRFIIVISGTWWVGTGRKFDPETTTPFPAGSVVTHFAKNIHYDGAKDEEALLEIVGEGPGTVTPAEDK